jgi:hypothetical protein
MVQFLGTFAGAMTGGWVLKSVIGVVVGGGIGYAMSAPDEDDDDDDGEEDFWGRD